MHTKIFTETEKIDRDRFYKICTYEYLKKKRKGGVVLFYITVYGNQPGNQPKVELLIGDIE